MATTITLKRKTFGIATKALITTGAVAAPVVAVGAASKSAVKTAKNALEGGMGDENV